MSDKASPEGSVPFLEPEISVTFTNHNKLLSWCDGVFGIKTGFTKKSGRCLVTACERDGRVLIAVTLNAGDDWNDHMKLYDYGFSQSIGLEVYIRLPEKISVYSGTKSQVNVAPINNPVVINSTDHNSNIRQKIYMPEFIYAPVNVGDVIGKAELIEDDKVIGSYHIVAGEKVSSVEPAPVKQSLWSQIKEKFRNIFNN